MIMKFIEVSNMLSDAWRLYKKYAVRFISEEELEGFCDAAEAVYNKYKKPLAKDIVLAVVGEIERSVKHFERRN